MPNSENFCHQSTRYKWKIEVKYFLPVKQKVFLFVCFSSDVNSPLLISKVHSFNNQKSWFAEPSPTQAAINSKAIETMRGEGEGKLLLFDIRIIFLQFSYFWGNFIKNPILWKDLISLPKYFSMFFMEPYCTHSFKNSNVLKLTCGNAFLRLIFHLLMILQIFSCQ